MPVHILDMRLYTSGCHTIGVHGQDVLFNVLADTSLVFQHLRPK